MDIPLYYKIYNDLLRKIGSEEYPPGSVLPTDGELEELYGVSKAPVRQALEN
ncbi:GntR family transcriptional regulator [Fretibacterium fastidiosum]|uniref:GntR family transcriptional regulator n=1 Tax=Fretibacterium fastidiosum TaxID=651822 RepID=UPI003C700A9B